MTVVNFPSVPPWLTNYVERGFKLVFYPSRTKAPLDSDWPNKTYRIEDYNGQNVGVILGTELSPGHFLADIDFDWVPGIALSKGILPSTNFGFGHPPTKRVSHAFYTTPEPVVTVRYENIKYDEDDKTERSAGSKQCFVEMRGIKESGELGFQTMIPPSIWAPRDNPSHPGEKLEFLIDKEINLAPTLPRRTMLFGIACLLHANIPYGLFKHDMRLACAGFLIQNGLNREEATVVMKSVISNNGPHDNGDEVTVIESTLRSINSKQPISGRTKFIELLGRYGDRIVTQIIKWMGGTQFVTDSKGRVLPNQENIRRAMELTGTRFTYDQFANQVMIVYPGNGTESSFEGPTNDYIREHVWLELDTKFKFQPTKELFYSVTNNIAFTNKYHPVLDYLSGLTWDGTPRIDEWVVTSAKSQDTAFIRAVSAIFLMAAVKRVLNPGCKFDELVVFISSKQGLLKSTALQTLCPRSEWFSDNLPLNSKSQEVIEATAGKWIVEIAELNKMRSAQIEHVKAMLSRQTDRARLAYGREAGDYPRQWIPAGTTNNSQFLTDLTGNRRFWPIEVNAFDVSWIRTNRDQLWAEAFKRVKDGASVRLPENLYEEAEKEQSKRQIEDDWVDILDHHFVDQYQRVPFDLIRELLDLPKGRINQNDSKRIADAMQSIGFDGVTTMRDPNDRDKTMKCWKRNEIYSPEEWRRRRESRIEEDVNTREVRPQGKLKGELEEF